MYAQRARIINNASLGPEPCGLGTNVVYFLIKPSVYSCQCVLKVTDESAFRSLLSLMILCFGVQIRRLGADKRALNAAPMVRYLVAQIGCQRAGVQSEFPHCPGKEGYRGLYRLPLLFWIAGSS